MGDFIQTKPNEFVWKKKEDGHLAATRPPRHKTRIFNESLFGVVRANLSTSLL